MSVRKNIINQKFTRLLVVSLNDPDNIKGGPLYNCICDCGQEFVAAHERLLKGTRKSCGCLKKELEKTFGFKHGNHKHPLYARYMNMLRRCNDVDEVNYGGRGIHVCEEWSNPITGFETFVSDMGNPPSISHTIDRIDVNGDYSKENCRWETRSKQMFNQRPTRNLKVGLVKDYLADGKERWTARITVNYKRIFLGCFRSLEEAEKARKDAELFYFGEPSPTQNPSLGSATQ